MDEKLQLSELRALVNAFIDDTKDMLDDFLKERIAKFESDANAIGGEEKVPGDPQNYSKVTPRKRPLSFDQMMTSKMQETSVRRQHGRRIEIVSFVPAKKH